MDYALTKLGHTLLAPVRVLAVWAQGHRAEVYKAREAFDRRKASGAIRAA